MKICTLSDMHGHLPTLPESDLTLIAGDICPTSDHSVKFQKQWLDTKFRYWLKSIPTKQVIFVAGNHDFIFQEDPSSVPDLPAIYLEDSGCEFEGLKIWGSPWQLVFGWWAFNATETNLEKRWQAIPNNTNLLVLHAPPYRYGDLTTRGEHVGSPSLIHRIQEIRPSLTIFGHIHSGRGLHVDGNITMANVSVVNEKYEMVYRPMMFEVNEKHEMVYLSSDD